MKPKTELGRLREKLPAVCGENNLIDELLRFDYLTRQEAEQRGVERVRDLKIACDHNRQVIDALRIDKRHLTEELEKLKDETKKN